MDNRKFTEWLVIKGYTSTTIKTIIKAVEYFLVWMDKENISDITETAHNDIIAYVQHYNIKGTGKKTIAHYVLHLKKYFEWLNSLSFGEGRGEADNPCSNIKIKGIKRKVLYEILSVEELEKLYNDYATEINIPNMPMQMQTLARKRNKIMLGLLVYQGLQSEELLRLQITDVQLREGKIKIAAAKRSNERTLKLESHQVFDLLDYINDTRKQILQYKKETNHVQELFLNIGNSDNKKNMLAMMLQHIKQLNAKIKNVNQLRASVIVHWLNIYNLRKVQIMAGHKYISSTEAYKANNLESLKEDIKNYHPF
jgi:site-specific recombinase XerD